MNKSKSLTSQYPDYDDQDFWSTHVAEIWIKCMLTYSQTDVALNVISFVGILSFATKKIKKYIFLFLSYFVCT